MSSAVALWRTLAAFAVCVVGAAHAGCTGAPLAETQAVATGGMQRAPEALDLLTLLRPDVTGVLRVDVRGALYHRWVRDLLTGLILARGEGAEQFMRGLDHTDELVLGFWDLAEGQRVPPMLVMARGDFRSLPLDPPAPGQTVAHYRTHELRAEDSLRVTVRLGDHSILNGERELVLAALDVTDGLTSAAGPRSPLVTQAAARVGLRAHTLALALGARALIRASGTPLADSPQVLGFWADIAETVTTEGFITFADASAPAVFLAVIDNSLTQLRQSPEVEALDLVAPLERIELAAEGNELLARAVFGSQDVERLRRALDTVLAEPTP